ncbi:MAG: efflux RND transporter periplasmic adaptor subunit [Thermosynechococcaceae cyanobacterium]
MTHSSADSLPRQSLDESLDASPEQPTASLPKLSRNHWGLLLGGVLVLAGGAWGVAQLTRPPHEQETSTLPVIAVNTLTITPQSTASTLELSGTIRPLDQAVLSTRVTGRIMQLSLEAGDRVQKGQVVARIDVVDIAAQANQARSGVIQAQSGVAQAQSGVLQARSELSRAQAVLSQLESQRIEVQAALKLAQIDQQRMTKLQAVGAISQERLDQANTVLAQSKAKVAQVDAGMRQSQAAIAQAQAAIAQAQATVERAQAAVDQAESGVTAASAGVRYGTVIAPFSGVVVQKLAYEGEMSAPGTALLKIESQDRLQLEISVPEENLRFVRRGQPVQVRVDAANETFRATIGQIVPTADANSRSFLAKIPLPLSERLITGMFGRIALPNGTQQGIAIPKSALMQRGQLQGVYVAESTSSKPTATLRWVKTGKTQNGRVEIVTGLTKGDRIITSPIAQLTDSQPISVKP